MIASNGLIMKILEMHEMPTGGSHFWRDVSDGALSEFSEKKNEIQKTRQSLITLGLINNNTQLTTRGAVYQTSPIGKKFIGICEKGNTGEIPVYFC